MKHIKELIARVAPTPSTVLITGESGTGKEVIARSIHAHSGRADSPFVPVNIGGVPEALLESELFGHERGAFTGAVARKTGVFELAGGGTLFLDEIGEMPLHLQVKLLRVLQDRHFMRLGGTQRIPVGARIVAATNRDLDALVRDGRFREDLFYRLDVVRIQLPPLRDRTEDLPEIIGHLIARLNQKLGRAVRGLEPEALARLRSHRFPGNVRELENLLERAMIFAENQTLSAPDLGLPDVSVGPGDAAAEPRTVRSAEKQTIVEALRRWEGNRTRAAEELGITRRTLLNKIRQYGIDIPPGRR
jgi:two-component system response regulator AtoC